MAEYKDNLLGEANSFLEVLEQVSRLAPLNKPVLIIGERGTGKELIANRLHFLSGRWDGPFISLNCAALNENLLDTELFGHEAGAFTGAQKRHPGRFERADGGTLFLDELATAPMLVQEKLLRVIEYGELERVGGSQPLQVNVRLVCATNADLPAMVAEDKFRADLLDRLAFDVVQLPPLRERRSDIMLLADQFAIQMCRELGLPLFPGFSERATGTLLGYHWPGNIRELKNVVERSVYRHGSSETELDNIILDPFRREEKQLPAPATRQQAPALPLDLRHFQHQQEQQLLEQSLKEAKYNQKRAAELLGLTYHQLRALLKNIKCADIISTYPQTFLRSRRKCDTLCRSNLKTLKTMRLVLSSLFALGLFSNLAFAAPDRAVPPDIRDSGFVYCVSGQVDIFNPQKAGSGLIVDTLAAQLYDRLLDVDPYTYRLVPELAESWEVLDNGATYRFRLRDDVAFQHTPWFTPTRKLNADDVVFTFQRIFNRNHPWHNVNGGNFPYFDSLQFADSVKSVRKLDNRTVEFRLNRPDASFLWHLATHYASVMSAEYADQLTKKDRQERLDREPVGTGPFQLAEYRAGQYIRLQRHDRFWRGKPLMPQVIVDLGSGGTGRLSKLLTGECDVLAWPAASQLTILRDDPRLRLTLRPGMNIAYLAFNTDKPPLNNPAVRHALALAINNQRLMQSIYYGTAETAASILPRASWAYDGEAKITEYNPAKAREQLKALGAENLTLQLWVPTSSQAWNPSPLKTAELLQADMAQVGVKVIIVPVEGRFQEARLMDMNHDLTLAGWSTDSNDPDSFFRPLLSCAAINSQTNYAHWCNREFDAVLQKALASQQLASRIEAYDEAQNILARELPVLPLASSLRLQAYRYDIKGLVLSPFGNASFAGVTREKEQEVKKP